MSKRPFEQLGYCIQSVSLGASRRIYRVADAKFQVMFEYIFFKVRLFSRLMNVEFSRSELVIVTFG